MTEEQYKELMTFIRQATALSAENIDDATEKFHRFGGYVQNEHLNYKERKQEIVAKDNEINRLTELLHEERQEARAVAKAYAALIDYVDALHDAMSK